MCALNGWAAGRTGHIFQTHTNRSPIDVSLELLDSPIPEERAVPLFLTLWCDGSQIRERLLIIGDQLRQKTQMLMH
jgi:hypothetical protein